MTNYNRAFAVAALAGTALVSGCAGTPFAAPFSNPANSTVVNRLQDSGVKAYGSQACRDAKVEVVTGSVLNRYRSQRAYSPYFSRYNANSQFREAVTETSVNGIPYTMISKEPDSKLLTIVGTLGGGLAGAQAGGNRGGHGGGRQQQALGAVVGAGIGALAGRMGDNFLDAGSREAFDRCRGDIKNGAYDGMQVGATQAQPRPLGPGYRGNRYHGGEDSYQPRREGEAKECPDGFTCTPKP